MFILAAPTILLYHFVIVPALAQDFGGNLIFILFGLELWITFNLSRLGIVLLGILLGKLSKVKEIDYSDGKSTFSLYLSSNGYSQEINGELDEIALVKYNIFAKLTKEDLAVFDTDTKEYYTLVSSEEYPKEFLKSRFKRSSMSLAV